MILHEDPYEVRKGRACRECRECFMKNDSIYKTRRNNWDRRSCSFFMNNIGNCRNFCYKERYHNFLYHNPEYEEETIVFWAKRKEQERNDEHKKWIKKWEDIQREKQRIKRRNHQYSQDNKRKQLAQNNGKYDEDITLWKLYERDCGICYLCGKKCDLTDYKKNQKGYFIAGKNYPSIEHVIPLARGGTHSWDNIMLACMDCNRKKHDKIAYFDSEESKWTL